MKPIKLILFLLLLSYGAAAQKSVYKIVETSTGVVSYTTVTMPGSVTGVGQLATPTSVSAQVAAAKALTDANVAANTAAIALRYTQTQVNTLLQGYYLPTKVNTKAAAIAIATGVQPRIIIVAVDESDGNNVNNKYIYDGDNQPLTYPLF